MATLRFSTTLCALFFICADTNAQHYSSEQARSLATRLRQEQILTVAGERLLLRRIEATIRNDSTSLLPKDSLLWWTKDRYGAGDTIVGLSKASVLTFLSYCIAGEMWYRSAETDTRDLMKRLDIYGRWPPDPDLDSAGFVLHMQKLDSVIALQHPGKQIEAAIQREDPWPPGFHTFVFGEDFWGGRQPFGHGYISPTLSTFGKTRSRLLRKLRLLELVDRQTATKLVRGIKRGDYLSELDLIQVAGDRAAIIQALPPGTK